MPNPNDSVHVVTLGLVQMAGRMRANAHPPKHTVPTGGETMTFTLRDNNATLITVEVGGGWPFAQPVSVGINQWTATAQPAGTVSATYNYTIVVSTGTTTWMTDPEIVNQPGGGTWLDPGIIHNPSDSEG